MKTQLQFKEDDPLEDSSPAGRSNVSISFYKDMRSGGATSYHNPSRLPRSQQIKTEILIYFIWFDLARSFLYHIYILYLEKPCYSAPKRYLY